MVPYRLMQLTQNPPDALVSFSDFLLERFGLVTSMQVALLASIALHASLIVGVGLRILIPQFDAPHNVLDVVLVNAKSAAKPRKADALAQANLDGGGNTDQKVRAKTPLPALESQRQQDIRALEARRRQMEEEARALMTQLKSKSQVASVEARSPTQKSEVDPRELDARSLEIERLEAQIARQYQAYQQRPRRQFIGARTEEYRFAQYVDNWRQRVERIGNLNYPGEARARKLYGSLLLTVAIKADGEIEQVEVTRSSGYKVLDQAAVRIVRLAAPFDRFPDNIRRDTDVLHITRTWTFTRQDQLVAE
ncbi:MAG: TonB family protein [Bacillota bacterium]